MWLWTPGSVTGPLRPAHQTPCTEDSGPALSSSAASTPVCRRKRVLKEASFLGLQVTWLLTVSPSFVVRWAKWRERILLQQEGQYCWCQWAPQGWLCGLKAERDTFSQSTSGPWAQLGFGTGKAASPRPYPASGHKQHVSLFRN